MPAARWKHQLYALEGEIKARGARMKLAKLLADNNPLYAIMLRKSCTDSYPNYVGRLSKKIRVSSTLSLAMRAGFCGRLTMVLTNRDDIAAWRSRSYVSRFVIT
jgi:hypothetical protein